MWMWDAFGAGSSGLIQLFRSAILLHPVRDEDIGFMRFFAIAV